MQPEQPTQPPVEGPLSADAIGRFATAQPAKPAVEVAMEWIVMVLAAGYTVTAQRGDHIISYDGPLP